MTTEAELFNALKYRVTVSPVTGTRRYYNNKHQLHRDEGPAVEYADGIKMVYCTERTALLWCGMTATKHGGLME